MDHIAANHESNNQKWINFGQSSSQVIAYRDDVLDIFGIKFLRVIFNFHLTSPILLNVFIKTNVT